MALFTQEEAEASVITRSEAITKDDVHQFFCIRVSHATYKDVEFCDHDTASDATDAQIRDAIVAYLQTQEAVPKVTKPVHTSIALEGQTVGDIV